MIINLESDNESDSESNDDDSSDGATEHILLLTIYCYLHISVLFG